jgi:hypothetical protein
MGTYSLIVHSSALKKDATKLLVRSQVASRITCVFLQFEAAAGFYPQKTRPTIFPWSTRLSSSIGGRFVNRQGTTLYQQGKQIERGQVELAPKSQSCVWNSPIRPTPANSPPPPARLPCGTTFSLRRAACSPIQDFQILPSTIAGKPLSQGSCLDGLNRALRRRGIAQLCCGSFAS